MSIQYARDKGVRVFVVHYKNDKQATKEVNSAIAYMQHKYEANVTIMALGKEITSPYMIEWSQQYSQDVLTVPMNQIYLGIPEVNVGKGVSELATPALPAMLAKISKPKTKKERARKASVQANKPAEQLIQVDAKLWEQVLGIQGELR